MSGEALNMVTQFIPVIQKYGNIKIDKVDIIVEKYENGTNLKIITDEAKVGEMLSEMMIMVAKLAQTSEGKVTVQQIDKTKEDDDDGK